MPCVVEDTIQNGVKHTIVCGRLRPKRVEDTIQNGVIHTIRSGFNDGFRVEDTIQNGVKYTKNTQNLNLQQVEDAIQNGVKRVLTPIRPMEFFVKDIIQNGIKCVNDTDNLDPKINECMKDSVKDTSPLRGRFSYTIQDEIQNGVKSSPEPNQNLIQEVIKNDVQDVKHSYDFEKIVVDDVISDSI